ncbi:MAG: hypothetical protein PHV32_00500 [Eubacteriales bacterium]|nr:hypothetical protein [Eubacteriales bacterium]
MKQDKEVVRLTPDNLGLHRPATPFGFFKYNKIIRIRLNSCQNGAGNSRFKL